MNVENLDLFFEQWIWNLNHFNCRYILYEKSYTYLQYLKTDLHMKARRLIRTD